MTLSDGRSHSIVALSANAKMTRQAVTKHLRVLENAGLVRSVPEGRESRFAARPETVTPARDYLDHVSSGWNEALARLKAHVEEEGGRK